MKPKSGGRSEFVVQVNVFTHRNIYTWVSRSNIAVKGGNFMAWP